MNKSSRLPLLVAAFALLAMVGCATSGKHQAAGEYIDDAVITTRVKTAIFNEPTLKSAEINVETYQGKVQLSGFVSDAADINKAIAVTREVKGVTVVENHMRVK